MDSHQMEQLFQTHREAEARRDFDGIMETFTEDCYLETVALGSRSEGQAAARAAYVAYFTAFPDLTPDDRGVAFGKDTWWRGASCAERVEATGSVSRRAEARSSCRSRTSLRSPVS